MKKPIDIYIYSPPYDENSGGVLVLHRLCHLINKHDGFRSWIVPPKYELIDNPTILKIIEKTPKIFFSEINRLLPFNTNKKWNTPIKRINKVPDNNAIVIYPEVTFGNPLKAKNVVRWFLHQPGHFKKMFMFGKNELYYKFNSAIKDFQYCYSKLSPNELKVIYYPLDVYNNKDKIKKQFECCHLIRKGKHKELIHPENSICIDGLNHNEIAEIFKKTKRFISYDNYTAYSIFAVLCGCESIVVPEKGWTKHDWYPNESDRYGIAYGFDDTELIWSKNTSDKVIKHIKNEHIKSEISIKICLEEMIGYFDLK